MKTIALDKYLSKHTDSCTVHIFSGDRHCSCGRDAAVAELEAKDKHIEKLKKAVQMAYRKHHLDDRSIGWDELNDYLMTALCEEMGDKEFVKWLDGIAPHDDDDADAKIRNAFNQDTDNYYKDDE